MTWHLAMQRLGREFERLEDRRVLAAVPFGASPDDTAEVMLGDVLVSLVLIESDGSRDANSEDWTPQQIEEAKSTVREGLQWWEDLLDEQGTVHDLNFVLDTTFADQPVSSGYEPISRVSDDFRLWIEDFFAVAGVSTRGTFSDRIREFNHAQRLAHETNWAFTIFLVNAESDDDHWFEAGGTARQAFAYPGGQFIVSTSERPASTIAHETGHIFWALDEYAGSKSYVSRRGYYNTQNLNAFDDHPDPDSRVRSIMDSHGVGFATNSISPSAMEMIGWRDSDQDGIFDVLDVPHLLEGNGTHDVLAGTYSFQGFAQVQTLENLNTSGTGNAITLNQIDAIQVRFDDQSWWTVLEPHAYQSDVDFSVQVPQGSAQIEVRAVDTTTGVMSATWFDTLSVAESPWQNPLNALDVNGDSFVAPLDALLVINRLNAAGQGDAELDSLPSGPPYLDTSGDGQLSPLDALLVINELNRSARVVPANDPSALVEPMTGLGGDRSSATPELELSFSLRVSAALAQASWETLSPEGSSRKRVLASADAVDHVMQAMAERTRDGDLAACVAKHA